jgi:hypothetical protein
MPDELQRSQDRPAEAEANPAAASQALDPSLSRNPSADPQVPGKPARAPPRPPGEVGGHTVQPWEQDPAAGMQRKPTSKDVPPPQGGAAEAGAAGPGPGKVTTPAPGNVPSRQGHAGSGTASAAQPGPADAGATAAAQAATPERSASLDDRRNGAPAATRPPRPPVYAPQQGHEPAPRPPPSHQPGGSATDGDRLVEAITRAIAENIGKAFHQSVAQAVREVFPLSGRSVDQGTPAASPPPAFTQASTAAGTAGGKVPPQAQASRTPQAPQPGKGKVTQGEGTPQAGARRSDAGTGQHGPPPGAARDTAAPESPGPSGSRPTGREPVFAAGSAKAVDPTKGEPPKASPPATAAKQEAQPSGEGQAVAPDGRTGPATSMYGGTIEPPVPAPEDKSPPGNAAAAAADEESRKGNLV